MGAVLKQHIRPFGGNYGLHGYKFTLFSNMSQQINGVTIVLHIYKFTLFSNEQQNTDYDAVVLHTEMLRRHQASYKYVLSHKLAPHA